MADATGCLTFSNHDVRMASRPEDLTLADAAHPVWALRAAPALGAIDAVERLRGSRRVGRRFSEMLERRLGLPSWAVSIDWSVDGRAWLRAPAPELEARLLLLGAVANGPAVAQAVSRLAVAAMAEVLGEGDLRAAVRLADLGQVSRPLDTRSAAAVRSRFARTAAQHLAAWLDRQPAVLRHWVLLALPPEEDFDPYRAGAAGRAPRRGDADLIPALADSHRRAEGAREIAVAEAAA